MCRVLKVSRSGYYKWLCRVESKRDSTNRRLDALITAVFEKSKRQSGSHKIAKTLQEKGESVSRTRVALRMKLMGIRSKVGSTP
mgnify:CR=1 FL=1